MRASTPPESVVALDHDGHRLALHERGQTVAGLGAERLPRLGRVDALEPNLVLGATGIEHAERVAVVNAHHLAGEGGRLGGGKHARQGDGDDDGKKRRQCVAYFALAAALA